MMKTRKLTLGAATGALLAAALLAPAAAPVLARASGSLWTTAADCAPTNANLYAGGDWVYLRGADFDATTSFDWSISGLPGGASTDPGAVVAAGTRTTDATGSFCFAAYQIASGDAGEYRVVVTQGRTTKSDNYRVAWPTTGSTGGTGDQTGGTGGTGDQTGGTGGTGDQTGGTGGTGDQTGGTGGTGDQTGGTGDQTGSPTNDSNTGSTGDTGSTGSNSGSTGSDPTQTVLDATTAGSTPTQSVLGITSTHGSTGSLPATDTVQARTGSGGSMILIVGLAGLVGAALLFAPIRRRDDDRA